MSRTGFQIAGESVTEAVTKEFGKLISERDSLRDKLREWKAPVEELEGSFPVVVYFGNDADRSEFIKLIREAKPELKSRRI